QAAPARPWRAPSGELGGGVDDEGAGAAAADDDAGEIKAREAVAQVDREVGRAAQEVGEAGAVGVGLARARGGDVGGEGLGVDEAERGGGGGGLAALGFEDDGPPEGGEGDERHGELAAGRRRLAYDDARGG